MNSVVIHESGEDADKLEVVSHGNGLSYSITFGNGGAFVQGDDAIQLRDEFDALETLKPDMLTRDVWLTVLEDYL